MTTPQTTVEPMTDDRLRRPKVLVCDSYRPGWDPAMQVADLRFCNGDEHSLNAAMDDTVEILITDAMPGGADFAALRWVQLFSANTSQLIGHPLTKRDILFTSAAGVVSTHVAEFVVATALRQCKNFDVLNDYQRQKIWPDRLSLATRSLRDRRIVIVGYGAIGREAARLFSAFGAVVSAVNLSSHRTRYAGYSPYSGMGDPESLIPSEFTDVGGIKKILATADVIALTVPLTDATRGMIHADVLAACKPSAILINVSRGQVVNTPDLIDALDNDRLAHAYLDVFDCEPLPSDSPLWQHPKITCTPHMAGVIPNDDEAFCQLFLLNLAHYQAGRPLVNEVDRTAIGANTLRERT